MDKSNKESHMLIVNHRKIKAGKTFEDFHEAFLPPVNNPANYFEGSVKIYHACNVENPDEVITIAVAVGDLSLIQKEAERVADTEKLRSEKMREVADKVSPTKIYKLVATDILGE